VVILYAVGALYPTVLHLLAKQPQRHTEGPDRADRREPGREIAKANRHGAHARRLAGSRAASHRCNASIDGRA